ncbi:MAG: hypothetical protein NTY38_20660, partial [Acidobacteria bacterium]|nr:hypothetical protein [Acidobacteriota bacterium]
RTFLQTAAALPLAASEPPAGRFPEGHEIASRHSFLAELPTPDFFSGMLLGNGDIGMCVTVRPDALGLHLGKLDIWDIRVSEDHVQHLLPFQEVLKMWQRASEQAKSEGNPDALHLESGPVMREYFDKVRSSYARRWPRPWPAGILWFHWDSRRVRVALQRLEIASGLYSLDLEFDDLRGSVRMITLRCFVNWASGHVRVETDHALPVSSVVYVPQLDVASGMPLPELTVGGGKGWGEFGADQRLPATAPTQDQPNPGTSGNDRYFALRGLLAGEWKVAAAGNTVRADAGRETQRLQFDLALVTSLDDPHYRQSAAAIVKQAAALSFERAQEATVSAWKHFWSRSAVEMEDETLERLWYRNQYLLACCLREGKVAPGLFGNWCSGNIGTAWHGDYHMNYNTQQVFWGVFSSNHVEQHLPYVKLVENLMPMAEWNARMQFGLPGAYFPHSAYPVPSNVNPYPVPPWGYEICETPWTVQSLWWHYLYTLDEVFLRRAYPLLKAATDFLMAYCKKGGDGRYHLTPTVSPENWGLTVDQRLNGDCIIDLALTEFLLDAMVEASRVLGVDARLREEWSHVRANLAPYPTVEGPYGRVWLDIVGAPAEHVYNVPVTASPIFPAEQVGLDKGQDRLEIARRTVRTIRLEGGNDIVWQPLMRARLGMLDLEWFKREVHYCSLPNGVVYDRARQVDGRYTDSTSFDFMMRMGIWAEDLSLPLVLNECMLQSYAGVIRLFPNTENLRAARFRDLRAVGAFLVSAAWDGRSVSGVELLSEKGALAKVVNPWPESAVAVNGTKVKSNGQMVEFSTKPGQRYRITKAG